MEIEHAQGAPFAISSMFDRVIHPPRGRDGGGSGAVGTIGLQSGHVLNGKGRQTVPSGERLVLQMPGGGGLGEATARDPAAISRDVANGLVTVEAALDHYKVVVDADGKIDAEATAALRGN
jgi:N-methylhydantoinase B